jgi:hypothetical protein
MGVDPYAKKYGGNTHLHRSSALSKDEVKHILFNFGGDNPVIDAGNTTNKNILDQIFTLERPNYESRRKSSVSPIHRSSAR